MPTPFPIPRPRVPGTGAALALEDVSRLCVGDAVYPIAAVVEALSPHLSDARLARMRAVLAARVGSVALALEDLHHAHNAAACLRTADALGLQDVVAVGSAEAFTTEEAEGVAGIPRKISKAAQRWLDLHSVPDARALRAWADARGMALYATGPRATETVDTLPADRPVLLLFGNELEGVSSSTMALCDGAFRIPMAGFSESLNVSVAVGISLHALLSRVRARLAADGRAGDLPAERLAALEALWIASDVRGADVILRRKLGV
jgi:tRNA (guanosine-2'-O-)-methyltransferase